MSTPSLGMAPHLTSVQDGREFSFLVAQAAGVELEPWPLPTWEEHKMRLEGEPEYAGRILWKSDDGCEVLGIERCGPCKISGWHPGETLFFLEGYIVGRPAAGEQYEIRGGDIVRYPVGMYDEWTIEETSVKIFLLKSDTPLPY